MVKERRRGPAADVLMDLKVGAAAELPGIEHKGGGDVSITFEGFNEERAGHWRAPRVVPGVCPGCVFEGIYEGGGPGSLPKEFAVRTVGEAGT